MLLQPSVHLILRRSYSVWPSSSLTRSVDKSWHCDFTNSLPFSPWRRTRSSLMISLQSTPTCLLLSVQPCFNFRQTKHLLKIPVKNCWWSYSNTMFCCYPLLFLCDFTHRAVQHVEGTCQGRDGQAGKVTKLHAGCRLASQLLTSAVRLYQPDSLRRACRGGPFKISRVKQRAQQAALATLYNASLVVQMVKNPTATWETRVWFLRLEIPGEGSSYIRRLFLALEVMRYVVWSLAESGRQVELSLTEL